MNSRVILVIDDTEYGEAAVETLEFLGRAGFRGEIYIFYGSHVVYPLLSAEREVRVFTRLRLKASQIADTSKKRLENVGFKVRQVKILFGPLSEEVLKFEEILKPDLIVFGMRRRGLIERVLHGDLYREVVFNTKTPIIVCKPGFRRGEYCTYDESKCIMCELKALKEAD